MAKTRKRANRAKANSKIRAVSKKMEKEHNDRKRTGKPAPSDKCGATRANYVCTKSPHDSKNHSASMRKDYLYVHPPFEWKD